MRRITDTDRIQGYFMSADPVEAQKQLEIAQAILRTRGLGKSAAPAPRVRQRKDRPRADIELTESGNG